MEKSMCFNCGNSSGNWIMRKTTREYKGNGYCFTLNLDTPFCEKCNSPIYDKEVEETIREQANRIIREQTDIISKEEILGLLNDYRVSQKYLSKVMGWGEVTIPRYIKGNYSPNLENSNKLKSIKNPYIFLNIIEENVEERKNPLWKKLFANINQQILLRENEKGKLFKVIDWFLNNTNEEEGITHLALQKALYFVQAWNHIFNGEWMFEEECEAWVHGAVYRNVYDDFKSFGYSRLPMIDTNTSLTDTEITVLKFVKENYLDVYSAKTLEKICHLEETYRKARWKLEADERSEKEISKDSIATYYEKISKKYNISGDSTKNIRLYINELLFN